MSSPPNEPPPPPPPPLSSSAFVYKVGPLFLFSEGPAAINNPQQYAIYCLFSSWQQVACLIVPFDSCPVPLPGAAPDKPPRLMRPAQASIRTVVPQGPRPLVLYRRTTGGWMNGLATFFTP